MVPGKARREYQSNDATVRKTEMRETPKSQDSISNVLAYFHSLTGELKSSGGRLACFGTNVYSKTSKTQSGKYFHVPTALAQNSKGHMTQKQILAIQYVRL